MKKTVLTILLIVLWVYTACGASMSPDHGNETINKKVNNQFVTQEENPFVSVSEAPKANISLDCNTSSYSSIRRNLTAGNAVETQHVRIEEMINYFNYDHAMPSEDEPLAIDATISRCAWNSDARLLTVGIRTEEIELSEVRNNLVFLVDISNSMDSVDRLGLLQSAFSILTQNLADDDIVSIVTYADTGSIILEGANGSERKKIQNKIEDLTADGYTQGVSGIHTAYELAQTYFIEDGNNRIILATDGDLNVGIKSRYELESFVYNKQSNGIILSVLGFGYGRLTDNKIESLANKGGGDFFYVNSLLEARKALIEEIGGTLETVAKGTKAYIEFNPSKIVSYRMIGYDNKLTDGNSWGDDVKTDAGDIGKGLCSTITFEIVLASDALENNSQESFLKISVDYKDVETNEPRQINKNFYSNIVTFSATGDIRFISAVIEASLIMRDSPYKGTASLDRIITRLEGISNLNDDPYKAEFLSLMKSMQSI